MGRTSYPSYFFRKTCSIRMITISNQRLTQSFVHEAIKRDCKQKFRCGIRIGRSRALSSGYHNGCEHLDLVPGIETV
jgi:hypothetical protein